MKKIVVSFSLLVGLVIVALSPRQVLSYPNMERMPTSLSQPPLNLGLSTPTASRIDNKNRLIYLIAAETLQVVDLDTFALSKITPYNIASDDTLSGSLFGMDVDTVQGKLYISQEGGKLLIYDTADLTAAPDQLVLASGKSLTRVAADTTNGEVYVLNVSDSSVLRYNPISGDVISIPLDTVASGLTINNMAYVPNISGDAGALYLSSTSGRLLTIPSGGTTVTVITLDQSLADSLKGIAASPDSSSIYVVNASQKLVHIISTSTNSQSGTIDLGANSALDQITVTDVTNPSGTYGFVMGSLGVSVFDTTNGTVFDLGTTDTDAEPLSVSGTGNLLASDDGYIFIPYGQIAVVTDNPFVSVTGISYSGGGSALSAGGEVVITLQSDEVGSYELRVGKNSTGSILTDTAGDTSGTITAADTDQSVTIAYDDTASLWTEGVNDVFISVTDANGNRGHMVTNVTVDNPPPTVDIERVDFGDKKLQVTLTRLTQSDISTYQVYAETTASAVTTSTTVAGVAVQPISGDTVVVTVTGLVNGQQYFIGAEALDSNGSVSASRTVLLTNGNVATGVPELTLGPAGASGQAGCSLIHKARN